MAWRDGAVVNVRIEIVACGLKLGRSEDSERMGFMLLNWVPGGKIVVLLTNVESSLMMVLLLLNFTSTSRFRSLV